jgi:ethanolamine utilization protein EutA
MNFVLGGEHALSGAADRLRYDDEIDELCVTGGVAELICPERHADSIAELVPYNDLGLCLAANLAGRLMSSNIPYFIPQSPIRATVIGAGMHALQVTGSTIDVSAVDLPVRNVPMIEVEIFHDGNGKTRQERLFDDVRNQLRQRDIDWRETPIALSIKELPGLSYSYLKQLSIDLAEVFQRAQACPPYIIALEDDAAAAIGLLLRHRLGDANILVIDGIESGDGDYLDVGRHIVHSQQGETSIALPVVIKSLVFR